MMLARCRPHAPTRLILQPHTTGVRRTPLSLCVSPHAHILNLIPATHSSIAYRVRISLAQSINNIFIQQHFHHHVKKKIDSMTMNPH